MRRTITLKDGQQITIEGSPEEIAEYERIVREREANEGQKKDESPRRKGKRILNEDEKKLAEYFETFKKMIDEYVKNYPTTIIPHVKHCNPECYACNGRAWFGVVPPDCICFPKCVEKVLSPYPEYTITSTTVDDGTTNYVVYGGWGN